MAKSFGSGSSGMVSRHDGCHLALNRGRRVRVAHRGRCILDVLTRKLGSMVTIIIFISPCQCGFCFFFKRGSRPTVPKQSLSKVILFNCFLTTSTIWSMTFAYLQAVRGTKG